MLGGTDSKWASESELLDLIEGLDERARSAGDGAGYGLVLVNLVGLRHINSRHGRGVGDLVIEDLAQRLQSTVPSAANVARVGPSEFAVLTDDVTSETVTQLARRVRQALSGPVVVAGHQLVLEFQVTPRGGPNDGFPNVLWAARFDARWDGLRPLLQRVEALEESVGLNADARVEILELTRRLTDAEFTAHRDGLTGVLNRIGTEQALAALPVPFALAFVDLDGLGAFNKSVENYEAGDEALRTVARLMREAIPHGMVGRWGGDEFVVADPDRTHDQLAEELRSVLANGENQRAVAGRRVTFSAGTAMVSELLDREQARRAAQEILRYIKDNDLRPAVLDHLPGSE